MLVRIAGKRLAGQTTTFDLIVLISLGVVMQSGSARRRGPQCSRLRDHGVCAASPQRRGRAPFDAASATCFRGKPPPLDSGRAGSREERSSSRAITHAELLAGVLQTRAMRTWTTFSLAVLEETGHISALGRDG